METEKQREGVDYLEKFTSRKDKHSYARLSETPDSLRDWIGRYLELAVVGVRSKTVAEKAALHLGRFVEFFEKAYGHDRVSSVVRRDVQAWQRTLVEGGLAPSTVNNHLASLSAFTTWVEMLVPDLFPAGDPAKGIKELRLPPLEPRALSEAQVRSLKNVCDRLERFHELRGREWKERSERIGHPRGRPIRDRAIIFVLLSTGLRREELVTLDLGQVQPNEPKKLRAARLVRVRGVKGKGGTERNVFLSNDAREALAEYLESERTKDAGEGTESEALFLSAVGNASPARGRATLGTGHQPPAGEDWALARRRGYRSSAVNIPFKAARPEAHLRLPVGGGDGQGLLRVGEATRARFATLHPALHQPARGRGCRVCRRVLSAVRAAGLILQNRPGKAPDARQHCLTM